MISTAAFPISQALGPRLLLSVYFLTWSPHWFLGNFLSRLLILCLLEEIWIMTKLDHFLLCLMIFQSGVLYLCDGCRLPAKPNRRPIPLRQCQVEQGIVLLISPPSVYLYCFSLLYSYLSDGCFSSPSIIMHLPWCSWYLICQRTISTCH